MGSVDANREVTPALIRGRDGAVTVLREGELAPGLEGQLCHHVYADGGARRESTVVLTAVPEGVAFAPALVCRDRHQLDGSPAQLPSERWQRLELESVAFERRYRLLALVGQDPGYVRELLTPSLLVWLTEAVLAGFSFELNERFLLTVLPGLIEDEGELARLCALAAELARRFREEASEEGERSGLFDEAEKLAEIEAALGKVSFEPPPPSAYDGFEAFREAARWRPTVVLRSLFWGVLGFGLLGVPATLVFDPIVGILAAAAGSLAFYVARILASADYRWGWAFHSRHRRRLSRRSPREGCRCPASPPSSPRARSRRSRESSPSSPSATPPSCAAAASKSPSPPTTRWRLSLSSPSSTIRSGPGGWRRASCRTGSRSRSTVGRSRSGARCPATWPSPRRCSTPSAPRPAAC